MGWAKCLVCIRGGQLDELREGRRNRQYIGNSHGLKQQYRALLFTLRFLIQGGSNMTGTDLYVNKPHCAAAV